MIRNSNNIRHVLTYYFEAVKKVNNKPLLAKRGCNLCLGVSLSVFMTIESCYI